MSLDINGRLPPVVHSAGKSSSFFAKRPKLAFVFVVFAILGALAWKRYFYPVQPPTSLPGSQDALQSDGEPEKVDDTSFSVLGERFQNNQEYMEHLYNSDSVFRSIGNHDQAMRSLYTHFRKFHNNNIFRRSSDRSNNQMWLLYCSDGSVYPINTHQPIPSLAVKNDFASRNSVGPRLTAQEVYEFLELKQHNLD